jgi:hypothetical protein
MHSNSVCALTRHLTHLHTAFPPHPYATLTSNSNVLHIYMRHALPVAAFAMNTGEALCSTSHSDPFPEYRELGKHCWTAQYSAVPQLSDSGDRPLLTANDRGGPMVRACRGHGQWSATRPGC